jgi:uncharacterized protein DUF1573
MGKMRSGQAMAAGIALFLSTASAGMAGDGTPRLHVFQSEIDLGTHRSGPSLWFPFKLRNEGSAPLEIKQIQLSCGCLSVTADRSIPPGKEITFNVQMATGSEDGPVSKTIRVTTNDPQTPDATLTAKALLQSPIHVLPGRSVPLPIKRGEEAVTEVTLESREPEPLEIIAVAPWPAALHAEALPAGKDLHVRKVRLSMAAAEARPFFGTVIIYTNCRPLPQVALAVHGQGEGAIDVLPPRLYYSVYERQTEPQVRRIKLTRPGRPFRIEAAESDNPALHIEVPNRDKTESAEVLVIYGGGWKPGKMEGKIRLTLSDTDWPSAEVAYSAEVLAGKEPAPPPSGPGSGAPGSSPTVSAGILPAGPAVKVGGAPSP